MVMRFRGPTFEVTDRRWKRALAANPASDDPARPKSKWGVAVRVQRLFWAISSSVDGLQHPQLKEQGSGIEQEAQAKMEE